MKFHNDCIVMMAPVNIFLALSEFVLCDKCTTVLIAISCVTVNLTQKICQLNAWKERERKGETWQIKVVLVLCRVSSFSWPVQL